MAFKFLQSHFQPGGQAWSIAVRWQIERQRLHTCFLPFAKTLAKRFNAINWAEIEHRSFISAVAAVSVAFVGLTVSFLWPRGLDYSLAKSENCFTNPVILPHLVKPEPGQNFSLTLKTSLSILGYPIYSGQTCVVAARAEALDSEHQLVLTPKYLPFVRQELSMSVPAAPSLRLSRPLNLPVSTQGALAFLLDVPDTTFAYRLYVKDRSVACASQDSAVLCNTDGFSLKQNQKYDFRLERLFGDQFVDEVFNHKLSTVGPIVIVKSSVKANGLIFDKPTQLSLTTNKPVAEIKAELFEKGKNKVIVPVSISFTSSKINIVFDKPLKRSADFVLELSTLTAQDGGYLLKPYSLKFSTSGGPKIVGANVAGYGVSTTQSFALLLDVEPAGKQNLRRFIVMEGSGFDYNVALSGKTLSITPKSTWPRCSRFTIIYKDGLKNKHGVSGGSSRQYHSRTICRTTSVIGSSENGRSIYAHRFGNGGGNVVFVGGTHGDEPSSVYLLNSWVDWLEANYDSIPGNRTVFVVPDINPDGRASGRRTNANDVDLNRNFPANNWKKDVIMPGGSLNKGGGGSAPLSESESAAIASYTLGLSPRLVLTYHAVGSLVIANESGNSRSLASSYGQHTGFWAMGNSEIGGVFTHDTTGAYEDWLHDKHGIPALLIELSSYGGNEFWHHKDAMWAMINS